QRRLMLPAFHKKRIEAYRDDMVSIIQQELDSWSVGQVRNVHESMMFLTMRVAAKTLFGQDIRDHDKGIGVSIQKSMRLVLSLPVIMLPYDIPGFPYWNFVNVVNEIDT